MTHADVLPPRFPKAVDSATISARQPRAFFDATIARDRQAVRRSLLYRDLLSQAREHRLQGWEDRALNQVATLGFLTHRIDLLEDGTVFLTLYFSGDISVDIQIHDPKEAFFAVYRNETSTAAGFGTLPEVLYDVETHRRSQPVG